MENIIHDLGDGLVLRCATREDAEALAQRVLALVDFSFQFGQLFSEQLVEVAHLIGRDVRRVGHVDLFDLQFQRAQSA